MNRWGFLILFLHISLLPETCRLPVNSMQGTTVFQLWFVFPMTGVCGLQTTLSAVLCTLPAVERSARNAWQWLPALLAQGNLPEPSSGTHVIYLMF